MYFDEEMSGYCEHEMERSGSRTAGQKFYWPAEKLLASQEVLWFI
jgi:hypothetical protein